MRALGWFLMVVALAVGAGFWLVPVEVSVLGSSGSCGPPIERVIVDNESGFEDDAFGIRQQCHDRSAERLMIGVALGAVLGIAGFVMVLAGGRSNAPAARPNGAATGWPAVEPHVTAAVQPGWYPDPWKLSELRWWDGRQWTAHASPSGAQHPHA